MEAADQDGPAWEADVADAADADVFAELGIDEAEWDVGAVHATISSELQQNSPAGSFDELPPALPAGAAAAAAAPARRPRASSRPRFGNTLAECMPAVLPLLGPDGDSLPARPEHLSEHSSGGQQAPVLFREQRPAPKRRYSKTRKGSPKDIWKNHGGKSVSRLALPPELQRGAAAQELVRRTGKVVRHGREDLRFHQYEVVQQAAVGAARSPEAGVVLYHVLGPMADSVGHVQKRPRSSDEDETMPLGRSGSSVGGLSTGTEEEEGDGQSSSSPPGTTMPVLDVGKASLVSGQLGLADRRQRQRTGDGEGLGLGNHLLHSSVTVATVGSAMYLWGGTAMPGGARGRVLLGETVGPLFQDAGQTVLGIVEFIDDNFVALESSEFFALAEHVLLVVVAAVALLDALFDLRRAPTLDTIVAMTLRQTTMRFAVSIRSFVLWRRWLGVWSWPAHTIGDRVMNSLGYGATQPFNDFKKTKDATVMPVFGGVLWVVIVLDSLSSESFGAGWECGRLGLCQDSLPTALMAVRFAWGFLHYRRRS